MWARAAVLDEAAAACMALLVSTLQSAVESAQLCSPPDRRMCLCAKACDRWSPVILVWQNLLAAWLKHAMRQVLQALSQHAHAHAWLQTFPAHDIALSALMPSA